MPNWAKNTLWILLFLILLAHHSEVGEWLTAFGSGLKELFPAGLFHYDDPVIRFMVTGVLIVAAVAMWTVFWRSRSSGGQ